jgi:hypothetical protein
VTTEFGKLKKEKKRKEKEKEKSAMHPPRTEQ